MAVFAAIQALLQEGDECVLIGPSWVSYEPCVAFAGGSVAWGKVDDNFMPLNIAESITPKTRLIIVNSPSNPTVSIFVRKVLEKIRDLAVAGVAAMQGPQDEIASMVTEFRARRDLLVSGLRELGMPCSVPGGANHVRLSYATSQSRIKHALQRIETIVR